MWIETALLYAWIRVCLRGAGSPLCLCLEQRNCAGHTASPQPCRTRAPRVPRLAVIFRAPQGSLGEPPEEKGRTAVVIERSSSGECGDRAGI